MEALNTLSSLGVSWPLVASCGFLWLLVASLHFLSTLTATHGQSLPRYSAGTSRGDGERQHAQEQNETQLSAWNLAPQVTQRVNESFKKSSVKSSQHHNNSTPYAVCLCRTWPFPFSAWSSKALTHAPAQRRNLGHKVTQTNHR